jgi:hypothetical protein
MLLGMLPFGCNFRPHMLGGLPPFGYKIRPHMLDYLTTFGRIPPWGILDYLTPFGRILILDRGRFSWVSCRFCSLPRSPRTATPTARGRRVECTPASSRRVVLLILFFTVGSATRCFRRSKNRQLLPVHVVLLCASSTLTCCTAFSRNGGGTSAGQKNRSARGFAARAMFGLLSRWAVRAGVGARGRAGAYFVYCFCAQRRRY